MPVCLMHQDLPDIHGMYSTIFMCGKENQVEIVNTIYRTSLLSTKALEHIASHSQCPDFLSLSVQRLCSTPRNPRQHIKHPPQIQPSIPRVCQVSVTNFLRFFQGKSLENRINSLGACGISVKLGEN